MSRRDPGARFRAAGGEDYRDKLMRLPGFLRAADDPHAAGDLADAFALTGFFPGAPCFRAARAALARRARAFHRRRSCSERPTALTRRQHGQEGDSPDSRRRAGYRTARGAGGALPRVRAFHHHAPRAARRARRAQAGAPAHPLRHAAASARSRRGLEEIGQDRRRRDGQFPSARRSGDLRRAGAAGAGFFLALSAGRRPGQFRQHRRR